MTPSETLYRICPLVWVEIGGGDVESVTVFGTIQIHKRYRQLGFDWLVDGQYKDRSGTLSSAKFAAEAWYRSRMAEGLEVVT